MAALWERQYALLEQSLRDRGADPAGLKERLKRQVIELPSWAVGNSGTRYGTFRSDGAAVTIWDKIDNCRG
jgi:L-rhamnose isomerase/sugar isomerase